MPVNFHQSLTGTGEFHSRIVTPKNNPITFTFTDQIIIFKRIFALLYNEFLSILILKSRYIIFHIFLDIIGILIA